MNIVKSGDKFGEWTVIEENRDRSHRRWLCVCKCGIKKLVYQCHLRSGRSLACSSCANKTHGFSNLRAWVSWTAMRERCLNNRHEAYKHYGGRGIIICERWDHFENFLSDMGERPDGLSLERKDTNGDYTPSNCVWASAKEQSNNQRSNKIVEYRGEKFTVAQLADRLGLNYQTLRSRISRGTKIDGKVREAKVPHAKNPSKTREANS